MEILLKVTDDAGNTLEIYTDKDDQQRVLKLKLDNESRTRHIASISLKDRTIEFLRKKDKHLYRRTNSYGVNEKIISDGQTFDTVVIRDETDTYVVPRDFILKQGKIMFHKEKGFERQLFITLESLQAFKKNDSMF
jgi:hypothetical protein